MDMNSLIGNYLNGILTSFEPTLIKIGVFIVALLLIIVGFTAVVS